MHRDVVHHRLMSYLSNCRFEAETFEDGIYRFLVILQIGDSKDLITIKQVRFNRFLGFADPVTGKQISEQEALKPLQPPTKWQKYKTKVFECWDFCFRILATALLGAIFFGWIYG